MKANHFYVIKDEFFDKVNDPSLMLNKKGRPCYYCIKEQLETDDIYWMIPLSSKIEKYKKIMNKRANENKKNDILHICTVRDDIRSVFLIQNIFPITSKYIKYEYKIYGKTLILEDNDIKTIEAKARKIIYLLKKGISLSGINKNIPIILEFLENDIK